MSAVQDVVTEFLCKQRQPTCVILSVVRNCLFVKLGVKSYKEDIAKTIFVSQLPSLQFMG